jgi:hypothetical protein
MLAFFKFEMYTVDPSYEREISEANEVIEKIERYKTIYGKYPDSLEEIGMPVTESGPFYYDNHGSLYTIYFSIGVGSSMFYSSDTKKWRAHY